MNVNTELHALDPIHIFHLSDLHLDAKDSTYLVRSLKRNLLAQIQSAGTASTILVCTGDLTFQGSAKGLNLAKDFLLELLKEGSLDPKNLILCPGNHDMILGQDLPLKEFDSISYALRHDHLFQFSKKSVLASTINDIHFLVLNSSYRFDHAYGFVDLERARNVISQDACGFEGAYKIAILHHNLLGVFEQDSSTLRNAYSLLKLLDENSYSLVLHGHQHASMDLPIGENKIRLFGARTLNYQVKGYQNGFNHYEMGQDGYICNQFIYVPDHYQDGEMGCFLPLEEIRVCHRN